MRSNFSGILMLVTPGTFSLTTLILPCTSITRFNSLKTNSVKKELGLNERVYICSCGNRMDRDVNAAINIREEGRRMLSA